MSPRPPWPLGHPQQHCHHHSGGKSNSQVGGEEPREAEQAETGAEYTTKESMTSEAGQSQAWGDPMAAEGQEDLPGQRVSIVAVSTNDPRKSGEQGSGLIDG